MLTMEKINDTEMKARKRTLTLLKKKYKTSIHPIPKVYLKVMFRPDGSYCVDFGYRSLKILGWNERNSNGFYGSWGGQDYVVPSMWRYIQKSAYNKKIHPLDLVNP